MRGLISVGLVLVTMPVLAQTQPTRPSANATYRTMSTFPTAAISPCYPYSSFNPTSSCYTGTAYPSYSAVEPFEFPSPKNKLSPAASMLDDKQAKLRIEAKGYLNVSNMQKDPRGIWRGTGNLKDGRTVDVVLDLEGNIYSEPSTLLIRIEPARPNR